MRVFFRVSRRKLFRTRTLSLVLVPLPSPSVSLFIWEMTKKSTLRDCVNKSFRSVFRRADNLNCLGITLRHSEHSENGRANYYAQLFAHRNCDFNDIVLYFTLEKKLIKSAWNTYITTRLFYKIWTIFYDE